MGKNQHYVPQFLIKRFSVDTARKMINLYHIPSHKIICNAPIKSQACKVNTYGADQLIENIFADIESKSQHVISRLSKTHDTSLSFEERCIFQTFVYFQIVRTPHAVKYANEMLEKNFYEGFRDDKNVGKYIDKVKISYKQPYQELFKLSLDSQGILSDLRIGILLTSEDYPFLLGQHPAVILNPYFNARKWQLSGQGLGLKGICIFLPISSTEQIIFYDTDRYSFSNFKNIITLSKSDVDKINTFQFAYTSDCVFFSNVFEHFNFDIMISETEEFIKNDITDLKVERTNRGKMLISSINKPEIDMSFLFLGIKQRVLSDKMGPTMWHNTRERIRPFLEEKERNRDRKK